MSIRDELLNNNCNDATQYSNVCNDIRLNLEAEETSELAKVTTNILYPSLNDPKFINKISSKKEFADSTYEASIQSDFKEQVEKMNNSGFELQPYQTFVKNFLSQQTPYTSLLLFHGLGTGKTCSAIGVCEEERDFMKQVGITKKIMIIASENVQDNFRMQLFDESKLTQENGIWNITSCVGDKLLKEINPIQLKGITKEKIISQIRSLINTYYVFMGYGQFANYINHIIYSVADTQQANHKFKITKNIIHKLQTEFTGRLVVIDEVHNIRKTEDNENKKVASHLEVLIKYVKNMRFLLLSATPMYNTYKEIIWLINLMNINDRRPKIDVRDVFTPNGEFKPEGKELFIRKITGYVSFVRGENPFTFPYRVYPSVFAPTHTFPHIQYPIYQLNLKKIKKADSSRIISLYLLHIGTCNMCGKCQYCVYRYIIHSMRTQGDSAISELMNRGIQINQMETFGYNILHTPVESLIMSYPIDGLRQAMKKIHVKYSNKFAESFHTEETESEKDTDMFNFDVSAENLQNTLTETPTNQTEDDDDEEYPEDVLPDDLGDMRGGNAKDTKINYKDLTGKRGLSRMMTFEDSKMPPTKGNFEYRPETIEKYGNIFSYDKIGTYSCKIKNVLASIYNPETGVVSDGIILIYSQYIDSGLIPMALALEEYGFLRYGSNKSLFKTPPSPPVDSRTMRPREGADFIPASYIIITGDPRLSPTNIDDIRAIKRLNNKNGDYIKVVLISKAGSEGIDFSFIRQVHVLNLWFNFNLIEQIIGRAVRNFSHKELPFEKRNVLIYLYGVILESNKEESADLYMCRIAEYKSIQIGLITRVLKENAVDCVLDHKQNIFTNENMKKMITTPIPQLLANGIFIENFNIGDMPYSASCDYMKQCKFSCNAETPSDDLNYDTYDEEYIKNNTDKIKQRIKILFMEAYFYTKKQLIDMITMHRNYSLAQIYFAISQLITSQTVISDKYGRSGTIINIADYYLFQPIELTNKFVSMYERATPVSYKPQEIQFYEDLTNKNNANNDKLLNPKQIVENLHKMYSMVSQLYELYQQTMFVDRGETDWVKHCAFTLTVMKQDFPETEKDLLYFVACHLFDTLMYMDKLEYMNYLYSQPFLTPNSFDFHCKEYIEEFILTSAEYIGFILYDLNVMKLHILKDNRWVLAEYEETKELTEANRETLTYRVSDYNEIIGFIGYENNNNYLVFKLMNLISMRNNGARCDEAGKHKIIDTLNTILGKEYITPPIIKTKDKGNLKKKLITKQLCIIEEFMMRYFDKTRRNGKKWFMNAEQALYFKIYNVLNVR